MPLRSSLQQAVSVRLARDSYGKSGIRLAVVRRDGDRHAITDLDIAVRFVGDFDAAHVDGDNSSILPTDTMRATCYALARQHDVRDMAAFGRALVERFLAAAPAARRVDLELVAQPWEPISVGGQESGHAFTAGSGMQLVTTVTGRREGEPVVTAGIRGLRLLKTTGSAFVGFLRDEYTTLAEAQDRILATTVNATWGYDDGPVDYPLLLQVVPDTIAETFAQHDDSQSVQHTLHTVGKAVIDSYVEVAWIRLRLPNQHLVLADLSPFDLDNPDEVFVVTDRPFGVIEGAVVREGWTPPGDLSESLW